MKTPVGSTYYMGVVNIPLDAAGAADAITAIPFPASFTVIPKVTFFAPQGTTDAKYVAANITVSQFDTTAITGEVAGFYSQTVKVVWIAVEPH